MSSSEHNQDEGGAAPLRHYGRDLTTGSIPRHLVAFSLPMLAGSALQVSHSFINAIWVGRFIGEDALAAVTLSQPIIFIVIASAAGLMMAPNILVAQDAGARDWERLQRVVQTSYALFGALSFIMLGLGLWNVEGLLRLLNAPPAIFSAAEGYLRVVLWTLPFSFWVFLIGSMLRGIGDSKTPVYFQAVAVLINTILDPLLIFGLAGLPPLGLVGTAWATIISQAIGVTGLLIFVAYKRQLVNPHWRRLRIDGATALLLLGIGLPSAIQQSVVSVSLFGLTRYVAAFGADTIAAFGAGLRIDGVAFLPALTMGMAVSTLSGQNLGARQFGRVREVFRWGLLFSGSISLLIALAVITRPEFLIQAFTREPEVIAEGSRYLRIVGFTYVLYALMFVGNGVINGAGHTPVTTIISVVTLWLVRLPLAGYLARTMDSPTGIWYAMVVSVGIGMLTSIGYYATGAWKIPITNIRWFRQRRRGDTAGEEGRPPK
ncbi:MAG: MATE family efflux transporter [Armatimonadota bacterium]